MYLLHLVDVHGTYDFDGYHFKGTTSLQVDSATYNVLSVNPLFKSQMVQDEESKKVVDTVLSAKVDQLKSAETGVLDIVEPETPKRRSYRKSKKEA